MITTLKGKVHGKTIELQSESGLPDGQDVVLSVEPVVGQEPNGLAPANNQKEAIAVRKAWMRRQGFAEEEIEAACLADEGRLNLDEELANLRAAEELERITPTAAELSRWAVKH